MHIIKGLLGQGIRRSPAAGRWRRRAWAFLVALLVAAGTAGATVGADRVASQDLEKSRQAFHQSSAEVASALQLAIQHQDDLVVNASGFVVANPDASEADFRAWATSVHVLDRYPEVLGFGFRAVVPAAELPAFVARIAADPPTALAPDGSVQITPPGPRPFYCLTKLGQIRSIQVGTPAGADWCVASEAGPASLRARDSGQSAYWPVTIGDSHLLTVSVPVYQGGIVPTTVAARRAAILGWIATESLPKVLLDSAVRSHPEMTVAFRYHDAAATAEFLRGTAPRNAQSVTIDLHNGWTVQTSGATVGGRVVDSQQALALLTGGVLLSLLLGVLMLVLGTGRARALRLVEERTAQLRGAQAQLVDSARTAGMAEIATNVLHNVGNVLNSVNVSANLVCQKVRGSKVGGLSKATALMHEHADDLGEFLTTDAKGKQLPGYLDKLAVALAAERVSIEEELLRLTKGVAHIKEIVNAQQSLAGISAVVERVQITDLIEDALRMAGALSNDDVTVVQDLHATGLLPLDRHRVLLVVLNLIGNAINATKPNAGRPRRIHVRAELVLDGRSVSIIVADNGEGIPPENLTRIFQHGFTTNVDGHGFGLHSSALAAKEMGGTLTVHSDGAGTGAAFTLEVPLQRESVAA